MARVRDRRGDRSYTQRRKNSESGSPIPSRGDHLKYSFARLTIAGFNRIDQPGAHLRGTAQACRPEQKWAVKSRARAAIPESKILQWNPAPRPLFALRSADKDGYSRAVATPADAPSGCPSGVAAAIFVVFFAIVFLTAFFAAGGGVVSSVEEPCSASSLTSVRTIGNSAYTRVPSSSVNSAVTISSTVSRLTTPPQCRQVTVPQRA